MFSRAHICNGCGKSFKKDNDLFKHLQSSQKPQCKAEFDKIFEDQPLSGTPSSYVDQMRDVSQALYGFSEYVSDLSTRILHPDSYCSSLSSARSDSPEPISVEDDLENQDNILIDDGILEAEGDIDLFEDMPNLQEVSDDEDEGK